MFDNIRLKHGMFWRHRYPTPCDYKQESRLIGALLLIIFMLWLLASSLEYKTAVEQEAEYREAYQSVVLHCATQALMERNHRQKATVGFVFDEKLIGVDCSVLSDDAKGGLKS